MHIPGDIQDLLVLLSEGLALNRPSLGEERYPALQKMSEQMRLQFEADPEDKTGERLQGCKIIHAIEEILREARGKR